MRVYTAHLRTGHEPLLLREGWTWLGFIFGPLWLLLVGAWIPGLLVLAADILIVAIAPDFTRAPLTIGLSVLVGLLGRDLRRWSLARRGRPVAYVIAAHDELDAMRRLYDSDPALAMITL